MADFPLVLVLVAWLVVALAVTLIVVGIRELTRRGARPFAPTRRPRRRRP